MAKLNNHINNFEHSLQYIAKHWLWYLGLGIGLVVIGTLALVSSVFTTLISVVFLGVLLLLNGIMESAHAFKFKNWSGLFLHLFIGILYTVIGFFMIVDPIINAITLTLLLASFFIVGGIFRIIFALTSSLPNWGWLLLSGILTFILGILIWKQWPTSGLWVLGLFIGIDMIFSGWSWIILSLQARNLVFQRK